MTAPDHITTKAMVEMRIPADPMVEMGIQIRIGIRIGIGIEMVKMVLN